MTQPSTPLIDSIALGLYLYDDSIDPARAAFMIGQAQALCESVIGPSMPPAAAVVVTRVAGRGYVTSTSLRGTQMSMAGSAFGMPPGTMGGIFLTRQDKSDLRRIKGASSAFTINPLPVDYAVYLPPWDLDQGLSDPTRE